MKLEHIPNALCIVRILLVPPILWLLAEGQYRHALLLFFVAGCTDLLDGFLAKHFDWRSRLGGLLDPAADKLLLVSVFLALALLGLAPMWLFVAVVLRDVVIVTGGVSYRFVVGPFKGQATVVSKLNTGLQLLFVVVVLMQAAFATPPLAVTTLLGAVLFVTTVVSGADYVWTWGWRAWNATHQPEPGT